MADDQQAKLEQKLEETAAAYRKDKSEKNLRAHDRAAVALAEHRAKGRTAGGMSVNGDAKAGS